MKRLITSKFCNPFSAFSRFAAILTLAILVGASPSALAATVLPSGLQIMPTGDSITYGTGGSDAGYRGPLYSQLASVASGFHFVGTTNLNPGSLPTSPINETYHEGHSSYAISDVNNNLDGFDNSCFLRYGGSQRDPNGGYWLTGGNGTGRAPLYPDVILLLIGANDLSIMTGVSNRLDGLLAKIATLRPATRLIVAKITPSTSRSNVDDYNLILTNVVAKYQAQGSLVSLADLNTGFPSDGLSGDGIHPNSTGYSFMAGRWYSAILAAYLGPDRTWNNTADHAWGTAANWTSSDTPDTTGENAVFNTTASDVFATNTINGTAYKLQEITFGQANYNFGQLNFTNNPSGTSGWYIGNGQLGTGPFILTVNGNAGVNPVIVEGSSCPVVVIASGQGHRQEVALGLNGSNEIQVNGTVLQIIGYITNGVGVTAGLTKTGSGTLQLALYNMEQYSGDTTISAGTLQLNAGNANQIPYGPGYGNVVMNPNSGTATLDLNGNNQNVNGLTSSGAGSSVVEGTSGMPTLTVGNNNASSTFGGVIKNTAGTLALTKTGTGTLTLSGANTYTGTTTIQAGTLRVNGALAGGAVTVTNGAILGGNGTLGGAVTVQSGGTLAPGGSIGTLTVNNNLVLAGNLFIELNKSTAPSNDVVVVTGTLTNAGAGTVTVTNLGLAALAAGDRFSLFNKPLLNGQALAITPAPGSGLAWTNKLAVDGSIAVVSTVAPPVPATNLAIMAAGPASFRVNGVGGANRAYGLYASTNVAAPMTNWWLIGATNADAGGVIQFLDTQATNQQRFYRFGQ